MSSPEIVVKGRHLELSPRFRERVDEKLGRVAKFGVPLRRIDVEVSKESNPRLSDRAFEVELTCRGKGPVIRAEASAADQYVALDRAYSRLEERLRRHADRHRFHRHGRSTGRLSETDLATVEVPSTDSRNGFSAEPASTPNLSDIHSPSHPDAVDEPAVFESGPVVVREKLHDTVPMSVEQALAEMELIGHDFFLFLEADSATPAVVYRRRGYDYGLIRIDAGRRAE